jgi:hypothetical protein
MSSRATNLPGRPHRALRLGATPAHDYGGHAPRAGGCPARLPYTPTSLPYIPAPNTAPGSPTLYPDQPTLYPDQPTLHRTEILYTKPAIYPLILHITNAPRSFPYMPLDPTTNSTRPSWKSRKGSKQIPQ